jgi:hypothetical protein
VARATPGASAGAGRSRRCSEVFPDARFAEARHLVAGDRGLSEWRFTGTTVEGPAPCKRPRA